MSRMTMAAPNSARRNAIPRPMPEAAPVTMATLPSSDRRCFAVSEIEVIGPRRIWIGQHHAIFCRFASQPSTGEFLSKRVDLGESLLPFDVLAGMRNYNLGARRKSHVPSTFRVEVNCAHRSIDGSDFSLCEYHPGPIQ